MKLSVVILAKNEEAIIKDCLESVKWADEIILVDSGSTDQTPQIAKEYGAKIIDSPSRKLVFAKWRNQGFKAAQGNWVLYVDADERVTPELKKEIKALIKGTPKAVAYEIPRRNFFLGQEVRYGGAWPDYVRRFFLKKKLKNWVNDLHEHPIVEGGWGKLKNPLLHLTHRDLSSMIGKTKQWSKIEAELLYQANHPKMTGWRFIRIMLTEFWDRGIKKQGLRNGTVGWIETIFQMFSRFITYARLWELQQKKK